MEKGSRKKKKIIHLLKLQSAPWHQNKNENVEFKLSKLEKVVESMKDEIKQELVAFEDDFHSIKGGFEWHNIPPYP